MVIGARLQQSWRVSGQRRSGYGNGPHRDVRIESPGVENMREFNDRRIGVVEKARPEVKVEREDQFFLSPRGIALPGSPLLHR